jgi:trk system potassium uptake protein TrkH
MASLRAHVNQIGLEGALLIWSCLPLFLLSVYPQPLQQPWPTAGYAIASCLLVALSFLIFRHTYLAKWLGYTAIAFTFLSTLPVILQNPYVALFACVSAIGTTVILYDFRLKVDRQSKTTSAHRASKRLWWALRMIPWYIPIDLILHNQHNSWTYSMLMLPVLLLMSLFLHWAYTKKNWTSLFTGTVLLLGIAFSYIWLKQIVGYASILFSVLVIRFILLTVERIEESQQPWWEVLINQPSRVLITTFSLLSLVGTLFLSVPSASTTEPISLLDAAFSAVSAVCVTGLIVLDTPNDFTFFGQFILLLLIQSGGLGIMSITTLAIFAFGQRLSLTQERLMTSITDTQPNTLKVSLLTILKFTFAFEFIGAILLFIGFYQYDMLWQEALWKSIFTSVSAFCNAGFALQSDSLMAFQSNHFLLSITSILIIFGGIAPATALALPQWIKKKPIPIAYQLALVTSAVLLIVGTLAFLAFEWNGLLQSMSFSEKLSNAWFQSVTLRTAGFNSLDLAQAGNVTFIIMLVWMFIGGSPGGTAGGLKTTTIGLLALTFYNHLNNRNDIIVNNRRVFSASIFRAITMLFSGIFFLVVIIIMLEITQVIPFRDLVFEAVSALATVGLSTGATPMLDEIGKVIVIITMLAGRVGPMTLFMLLGQEDQTQTRTKWPSEKISLT